MTDERATFEQTRARLEEILVQVRKKDTSLEQSLDLLEEGVRLANACNELIDQTSWRSAESADESEDADGGAAAAEGDAPEPDEAADPDAEGVGEPSGVLPDDERS